MASERYVRMVAETAVGVVGLILVGIDAGWLTALGVFLMLWGNNLRIK